MEEQDEIAPDKRSSRGASTSLFLGMVAMVASVVVVGGFVGMLAVWLGRRALRGIYESEGRIGGRGMARGGVVMGWLAIAVSAVALVVWMFVPKIGVANDSENVTITLARMHQIMEGCSMFAQDHENHFPPHFAAAMTGYGVTPLMLRDARNGEAALPMQLPAGAAEGKVEWQGFAGEVDSHCDFVLTGAGLKISDADPRVVVLVAKKKVGKKWLLGRVGGEAEEVDDGEFKQLMAVTNEARQKRGLEAIEVK